MVIQFGLGVIQMMLLKFGKSIFLTLPCLPSRTKMHMRGLPLFDMSFSPEVVCDSAG